MFYLSFLLVDIIECLDNLTSNEFQINETQ